MAARQPNVGTPGQGVGGSFAQRRLDITYMPKSGKGKTYSGLRALVHVTQATMGHGAQGMIRIQGMTLSDINDFTRAGTSYFSNEDRVKVEAGDVDGQLTNVYVGYVSYAYPDFDNQPDVAFVIEASGTTDLQLKKADAQTFNKQVSTQDALSQVLKPAGVTIKNQGVNVQLTNPYYAGSIWQQMNKIVAAANAVGYYDPIKRELTIWPKPQNGSNAGGGRVVLVSPAQGMIGYPKFQQSVVIVRAIFTPAIYTIPGMQVKIDSQITSANGTFTIYQVDLSLSSEMPNGPWEMTMMCAPNGKGSSSSPAAPAAPAKQPSKPSGPPNEPIPP